MKDLFVNVRETPGVIPASKICAALLKRQRTEQGLFCREIRQLTIADGLSVRLEWIIFISMDSDS